jgi:HAD superfamily hydrolase (TIGR01509 family)
MAPRPEGPVAAAVFDNDGLLLDTEEAWTRAEVTLFARHGRSFTMEHKRDLLGSSRAVAAAKLEVMLELPGRGDALMDDLHELVMEEALAGAEPRPGAVALVAALQEEGVALALASNSPRAFVERVLGPTPLAGSFPVMVCGDEVEHAKPAPDLYLRACELLGVDPADAVALEDSPPGVQAARAAGLFTIGVPYFPDGELPGADLLARSLAAPEVARALGLQTGSPDQAAA